VGVLRRLASLAATVLVATALGHVFLTASLTGAPLGEVIAGTPAWLAGGFLFGTLAGVAGGRWCATRPRSHSARVLHVATAILLSSPPFFIALLVLFYFSSNVSGFVRLPFLSGVGDYVPFASDPVGYAKAMWLPWVLVGLPLGAFLLRRVVNLHALPVATPALAAMAGVSVSTLLLNAAVIEYAYSIPGMFRVIYTVARERDVAVMEALIVEGVVIVTLANFAADAVPSRLDPRLAQPGA
jgi:peptide/nickel transport system permease protein